MRYRNEEINEEQVAIFMADWRISKNEAMRLVYDGSIAISVNEWDEYWKQYPDIEDVPNIEDIRSGKYEGPGDYRMVEYNGVEYVLEFCG